MKITLARHSGFCMGVRKAILRIVHEINSSDEELCVYGSLIHNPQTIEVLHGRGMRTIRDLDAIDGKRVVIRTHGIPVDETRILKKRAGRVINLTCPRVARVQSIIKKYASRGFHVIITGDKDHAEVIGLRSFARAGVSVISDTGEVSAIPDADRYVIVSQTTFDRGLFKDIVRRVEESRRNVTVFDTICDATRDRQEGVLTGIAGGIDTLVVVGGRNSANTKRLARIGTESGIRTFHVETDQELSEDDFRASRSVLVTAGTSTPGWIINNILEKLYTINYRTANPLMKSLMYLLEVAVRTSILAAGAAYFISMITLSYAGKPADYRLALISLLYIFSMHTVNNYFERAHLRQSNPYKYAIYQKFGVALMLLAVASMAASIYLAAGYGAITAGTVAASCALGFIYSTTPLRRLVSRGKAGLIRRLYSSKLVASFGWVIITVMVPMLAASIRPVDLVSLAALVFTLVFLRTALLDLIAFQGDLIMGRETLPIWIGTRALRILSAALAAAALIGFCAATALLKSPRWLILAVPVCYYLALMSAINRLNYLIALKYELLVDLNGIVLAICYFLAG